MKPLLISSGEPAGIGPELCLALAPYDLPVVILGDLNLLKARAKTLGLPIHFTNYSKTEAIETKPDSLTVYSVPCNSAIQAGVLNPENSFYVIDLLTTAASLCLQGDFSALVTAPVHKANINKAGIAFTGHTEFFADYYNVDQVVMMLASDSMRVALVTTHLPLKQVPDSLSISLIIEIIRLLNQALVHDFGLSKPFIKVAGLNPHAGEAGFLGQEEIDVIIPALNILRKQGIDVEGPLPADTMFTEKADVYVAMYHDQGLPVLKYSSFNRAVNITLGLPIIRTSVDHGTALDLAGLGIADPGSLIAAVNMALQISQNRNAICP